MGKKFYIETYGCQMNVADSEVVAAILTAKGFEHVKDKNRADIILVNTCSVRENAEQRVRGRVQGFSEIRKQNPRLLIGVMGCMAERLGEKLFEQEKNVNIVVGPDAYMDLPLLIEKANRGEKAINIQLSETETYKDICPSRIDETSISGFVSIMRGCNNFCTYCIIPYARGRLRSRQKESVLNQAQRLVDNGYVEIVLTGIHTAGYGEDLDDYSFYELLVDLVKIKGLKRLRISSIETSQISDEIIDLIGSNEIIVDHLHVPLQAGSDATLKRMNRKYTTAEYLEKINKIRSYLPNIAFTTDVIVGFPGETDEEFEETYNFIKQVNYSELHVFPYSPRKNTPAAKMKDQVNDQIKHERANRLLQLSKELNHEFALKQIGKTLKVLFEKRDGEYLIGHAGDYLKVKVKTADNLIGEIVTIKIDKYDEILEGRVV